MSRSPFRSIYLLLLFGAATQVSAVVYVVPSDAVLFGRTPVVVYGEVQSSHAAPYRAVPRRITCSRSTMWSRASCRAARSSFARWEAFAPTALA